MNPIATPETPDNDKLAEIAARADKGEITNAEMQMELSNYAKAYQQEFEEQRNATNVNDPRVEENVELFRQNMGIAASEIISLMNHSDKDAIRLAAAKFIYSEAKEGLTPENDELNDILSKLQKGQAPSTKSKSKSKSKVTED